MLTLLDQSGRSQLCGSIEVSLSLGGPSRWAGGDQAEPDESGGKYHLSAHRLPSVVVEGASRRWAQDSEMRQWETAPRGCSLNSRSRSVSRLFAMSFPVRDKVEPRVRARSSRRCSS